MVVRLAYFDRSSMSHNPEVCFSGVGTFQVKYDGQMRTNEDEHSRACELHCLRVEKNDSGGLFCFDTNKVEWIKNIARGTTDPEH